MTAEMDEHLLAKVRSGDVEVVFSLPSGEDHISNVLKISGAFYEADFLDALGPVLSPGDLVLDVGANIGNHSLYFAKVLECDVIAFEAVEATADVLLHNVELNFMDSRVEVRMLAVGSVPGRAAIGSFDPANVGATALVKSDDGDITVTSLDAEHIKRRVTFIKIDVEGMDLEVICGGLDLIERDRPFMSCEAATPSSQSELTALLERIDYVSLGVYNATPTYLLAPARTAVEHAALVRFQGHQLQTVRDAQRDFDARLLRSNRYTERLHREALAAVEERSGVAEVVNAPSTVQTNPGKDTHDRAEQVPDSPLAELRVQVEQLQAGHIKSLKRITELEIELAGRRTSKND